jgi:hypothetical protein
MKCHTNINSTPLTQLPDKFSYIVAILGHNHFESPNMYYSSNILVIIFTVIITKVKSTIIELELPH